MSVSTLYVLATPASAGMATLTALTRLADSRWTIFESDAACNLPSEPPEAPQGSSLAAVYLCAQLPSDLPALLRRREDVAALVLVESPLQGLARQIEQGSGDDPQLWLGAWRSGAKQLLPLLQAWPDRVLALSWDEARGRPAALSALLRARFGAVVADGALPAEGTAPKVEPLSLALAQSLCQPNLAVSALYDELLACCQPLGDVGDTDGGGAVAVCDARAALSDLRALQQDRRLLEELRTEIAGERERTHGEIALLTRQQAQLQELSQREQKLLLLQLHQVQEELESTFLARRDSEARATQLAQERDAADVRARERTTELEVLGRRHQELQRQCSELQSSLEQASAAQQRLGAAGEQARLAWETQRGEWQAHLDRLRVEQQECRAAAERSRLAWEAQRSQLQADLERTAAQGRSLAEARDQATQEVARLQREALAQRERESLMQVQLRQMQEEVERHFLQSQTLRSQAARLAMGESLPFSIGQVVCTAQRDEPPHRELNFLLRDVEAKGLRLAEVSLRLVEHQGHPGLVIFCAREGQALLDAWQPNGEEEGRAFMRLLPADPNCRALLDGLGRSDWELLRALASRLGRALAEGGGTEGFSWRRAARRLQESLDEMPPRWRFDQVQVQPSQAGDPQALTLAFEGVSCGLRRLDRCVLRWRRDGAEAGLELLLDDRSGAPLPSWPHDDRGQPLASLHLPLGAEVPGERKRAVWRRLGASDREFLLALLAAWPAQAGQMAGLPDAAARLSREARSACGLDRSGWRRILDRLRRGA